MYDIIFYRTTEGYCPTVEFLNNLPEKLRLKSVRDLDILKANGLKLRMPFSRQVDNGLFELRIEHGTDICRYFYFFMIGKKIIVTHGFVKKSTKTPPAQIEKAKRLKADYLRRYLNG